MHGQRRTAHVAGEEKEGKENCLFEQGSGGCEDGGEDVDGLSYVGHAKVLSGTDEGVEVAGDC